MTGRVARVDEREKEVERKARWRISAVSSHISFRVELGIRLAYARERVDPHFHHASFRKQSFVPPPRTIVEMIRMISSWAPIVGAIQLLLPCVLKIDRSKGTARPDPAHIEEWFHRRVRGEPTACPSGEPV